MVERSTIESCIVEQSTIESCIVESCTVEHSTKQRVAHFGQFVNVMLFTLSDKCVSATGVPTRRAVKAA